MPHMWMFYVLLQRFAKDHGVYTYMYLSLFCGNLTTIDFHDNLDAGKIPGGSDGDGIGVTELKE